MKTEEISKKNKRSTEGNFGTVIYKDTNLNKSKVTIMQCISRNINTNESFRMYFIEFHYFLLSLILPLEMFQLTYTFDIHNDCIEY